MGNVWWVNHNQNWKHETAGGFLWCPQKTANEKNNTFYNNMTEAQEGDLIFAFSDSKIKFIGIVLGQAFSAQKPKEFGADNSWDNIGWKLPVTFIKLNREIKLKDHITQEIKEAVNYKYAPFREDGKANQNAYLSKVNNNLFSALRKIISEYDLLIIDELNNSIINSIEQDLNKVNLLETEKNALIKQRIGQNIFKQNISKIETACRITKISDTRFLIASHIKPWSVCNNKERLDKNNGLLLAPHIDKLFDQGYISFKNNGDLIISEYLPTDILDKLGIKSQINVGVFNPEQTKYLEYHRENILKRKM